jgi:HlyD family secretion protein
LHHTILQAGLVAGLISSATALAAPPATSDPPTRRVRATGVVRAVHSVVVQAPRIEGISGILTLATLIENGKVVTNGELLATFDRTAQLTLLRDAQAKYDDLKHQVEQKQAEHNANVERRNSDLQAAEADLKKAEIEIRKGPILSDIEQQKNQVKLADAQAHVASLKKSNEAHNRAEDADRRILELQRDRQKVAVERSTANSEKLTVKSPIAGMVALTNVWRNNTLGHSQEGDQVWAGTPLLQVFDPSEMEVELAVGEPDGAALVPGAKAVVHLDAFPDLSFTAHFDSASPVATSPLGTSLKTFSARFRLDQSDPRLLPDLSAALDIELVREGSK